MGVLTEQGPFVAKRVLVIYEASECNHDVYDTQKPITGTYVTYHRVSESGELLEGAPLTRQTLSEICALVMPSASFIEYFPENLLAYSPERSMLWWVKASCRAIFFSRNMGISTGTYPLPPLLFCVREGSLFTWALDENIRPGPSSRVFHSPFFNVHETGTCCMGNINLPGKISPGSIHEWEDVFFHGLLTSDLPPRLSDIEPEELWKSLRGKKKFPLKYLKPCSTLSGIIKSLEVSH